MQRRMVNLVELAHVVDLLERHAPRAVVDRALRSAGLERAMLSDRTGFLPYATEAVLLETVARAIGDRHLGARIGRDFEYATYGAYSSYVLGAPNLGAALDRGRRALSLTHPGFAITIRETSDHIVVGRTSEGLSVLGHRHLDEGALFVIGHVIRHFLGPDWRPAWVEIPSASPDNAQKLSSLVEAPVRGGAPMPAIALPRADLNALNPNPPRTETAISLEDLGALMGVAPVQTFAEAVVQILQIASGTALMSQNDVARLLAIGPRSLQRALKSEGTSFRSLQLQFLMNRAQRMLRETDLPVEEIAESLGYTQPKSFRRAFKAATGVSPSAFRTAVRNGSVKDA